jgi:hypothetical protein
MKISKSILVIGLCLALAGPALAQPAGGRGMRMYNPQTVTTIKGTVERQGPPIGRRMQHVSWVIKTDQGNVTVHLGPAWFIGQQQMVINPGDTMEATGSEMEMSGGTMMVAKEVTVKGKTLKLRNDQGLPVWRGQGRRQAP